MLSLISKFIDFQVQGMSFMAAMLLLNMEPANAFVTFANLLNKPCQVAFFRLNEEMVSFRSFYVLMVYRCNIFETTCNFILDFLHLCMQ